MKFSEYLNEKSIKDIKDRLLLLILNSFLYDQELQGINEKFIESKDILTGKNGLSSTYKIEFSKIMKSKSLVKIEDLQIKWLDNVLYRKTDFMDVDIWKLNDIEFIEFIDDFIIEMEHILVHKVLAAIKEISINKLKDMIIEFKTFTKSIIKILNTDVKDTYISILGNEVKRLMKFNSSIPSINIQELEESGCEYEKIQ